jgi:GGDEF domain-containing protein
MKRLRYWFAGTCIWFFFLYNIERLGQPVNIASPVYVFAVACALCVILLRPLHRMPLYWPFLMALAPYFVLKNQLGYSLSGENLPLTITEVCAIGLTILLTGQVARRLEVLEETVTDLTIRHLKEEVYSFNTGQGRIYREIRRARRYRRPVALLAITVTEESLQLSLDRFIQEAQREIIKKYIAARIAELLVEELQDSDVIAQRNDHFITLLPETQQEDIPERIKRLETAAMEKLGLKIKIGVSTFPDEAVTFEQLLEQAETKMRLSAAVNGDRVEHRTADAPGLLQA